MAQTTSTPECGLGASGHSSSMMCSIGSPKTHAAKGAPLLGGHARKQVTLRGPTPLAADAGWWHFEPPRLKRNVRPHPMSEPGAPPNGPLPIGVESSVHRR